MITKKETKKYVILEKDKKTESEGRNGSKANFRFNYGQEEKKSENKYRSKRIKTDYLNLENSKEPVSNVCTPTSQIDFYTKSENKIKHFTSLTSEQKSKKSFRASKDVNNTVNSFAHKDTILRSSNSKNLMFGKKRSFKKDFKKSTKTQCISPKKGYLSVANFCEGKRNNLLTSPVSRDSSKEKHYRPLRGERLKTRRKTNPDKEKCYKFSSGSSKKYSQKFVPKCETPKAHQCSSRLSSHKENENTNLKILSQPKRKTSSGFAKHRYEGRKSSTQAKKINKFILSPNNSTLLKPRKGNKNINSSRLMLVKRNT